MDLRLSPLAIAALIAFATMPVQSAAVQAPPAKPPATKQAPAAKTPAPEAKLPPVLAPEQFFGAAAMGYAAAKAVPHVCHKLFCYCGCDLTDAHTNLLDCFTNFHGADCHICQEEAMHALKMDRDEQPIAVTFDALESPPEPIPEGETGEEVSVPAPGPKDRPAGLPRNRARQSANASAGAIADAFGPTTGTGSGGLVGDVSNVLRGVDVAGAQVAGVIQAGVDEALQQRRRHVAAPDEAHRTTARLGFPGLPACNGSGF